MVSFLQVSPPKSCIRLSSPRLSATAYSIFSQLPSILEAVPPSATCGRAMLWWQGPNDNVHLCLYLQKCTDSHNQKETIWTPHTYCVQIRTYVALITYCQRSKTVLLNVGKLIPQHFKALDTIKDTCTWNVIFHLGTLTQTLKKKSVNFMSVRLHVSVPLPLDGFPRSHCIVAGDINSP